MKIRFKKCLVFHAVWVCILVLSVYFLLKSKQTDISKEQNVTCVNQQTTCCPCSMGGKEECMIKEEAIRMQGKLERECGKGIVCVAMYACEDFVCEYKNNTCVKVYQ